MIAAPHDDEGVRQRAWITLWHARVSWLLTEANVPHLLIKGATWPISSSSTQVPADVDVLVAPSQHRKALRALADAGLAAVLRGVSPVEVAMHSTPVQVPGGPEVDVHGSFPGLDRDPKFAWQLLHGSRREMRLGNIAVPVLGIDAQLLFAAAGAARDGAGSGAAQRLAALTQGADWSGVKALAERLAAGGTLRAGLEAAERGDLADLLALPSAPLRFRHRNLAARRLEDVLAQPWRVRMLAVGREFWPTRQFLRRNSPGLGIAQARRRHLATVFRKILPALWAVLRGRVRWGCR